MDVNSSDYLYGSGIAYPVGNPYIGTTLLTQGIGTATQGIGSYYQAQGQQSQLQANSVSLTYSAHMAALNARLAELQAQSALRQGQRQQQQVQLATGQMIGTQRASLAAHGIDLTSATPTAIQAGTEVMSQADQNTIQTNAIRSAWGYRTQATNQQNEAIMDTAGAASAGLMKDSISPGMNLAGTLLSSVGQVAAGWYRYANVT